MNNYALDRLDHRPARAARRPEGLPHLPRLPDAGRRRHRRRCSRCPAASSKACGPTGGRSWAATWRSASSTTPSGRRSGPILKARAAFRSGSEARSMARREDGARSTLVELKAVDDAVSALRRLHAPRGRQPARCDRAAGRRLGRRGRRDRPPAPGPQCRRRRQGRRYDLPHPRHDRARTRPRRVRRLRPGAAPADRPEGAGEHRADPARQHDQLELPDRASIRHRPSGLAERPSGAASPMPAGGCATSPTPPRRSSASSTA